MHKNEDSNIKHAIETLKNYCAKQDRCLNDINQKIQTWNLQKNSIDHITNLLFKEGYLNEERYSASFCRGKFRINKWGKIKIHSELKKKNISSTYITKGLQQINDSEYQEELNKQYHKKKKTIKEKNNFKKKRKIAAFLISRGFESDLVWEKINAEEK
tara:strand:+ start:17 stop:490 length:474 start_codon:yes stop_codon:yes gene_type:complete